MADELLPYYEKELAFIRQLGAEFADEHPKIAGRLGISTDTIDDPHVSRLVESFAYLNARIQHKIDDDFPELSDALLNVLFPHYQRPIPSMSIVHFKADSEQLESNYLLPRQTLLETEQFQGETVRFSTVYDTEMLPVTVESASLIGRPFNTPGSTSINGAASVLKISLQTFSEDIAFPDIDFRKVRFYLKGQPQHINPLYQMMLNQCVDVVICSPDNPTQPVHIGTNPIKPVGFEENDGLLPYPDTSFKGYRLLTEFFVFPEKFMFIDIENIKEKLPDTTTNRIDLYFYFNMADIELEHNINENTFVLGATPVINLFNHVADPVKLDHSRMEYQVIPDARRPSGFEIYSVDKVTASSSNGEEQEFMPFYGLNHQSGDENHPFWFANRRNAKMNNYERDEGTDIFLNLVDLDFNPNIPDEQVLMIETTCSNRDLPAKLPFSADQPKLQCVDSAPPCETIRCLTQPTATVRPPLRNHARWRLISHLNLNHLSITGRNNATQALKEILRLYDFKESSVTRALIESIVAVNAKPISAPLNIDGHTTLCRGMQVEITLDDHQLAGSSAYLFASILEYFFGLYCSINSFTRVLVKLKSKEGYLKKCPPRAGEKILL